MQSKRFFFAQYWIDRKSYIVVKSYILLLIIFIEKVLLSLISSSREVNNKALNSEKQIIIKFHNIIVIVNFKLTKT